MLPIKSIMTTKVISVREDTPITEALELLTQNKISGMPVVDEINQVKGMLSEKDLLRILIDPRFDIQKTVQDYMTYNVTTFTENASAIDVCKFFINNHFRRVPIVREGRLVGIVSRRDIIHLILEAKTKIDTLRYS
jgi:CBS domain-containing protein